MFRNNGGHEYVAIKILKAAESHSNKESTVYSQLSEAGEPLGDAATASSKPGSPSWTQWIVPLLSSFTHLGPNGNHTCLVYELMGCSVGDFFLSHPSIPSPLRRGLNTRQAKSILRQILEGLVVLHSKGLIHGDLHSGNALLPLRPSQDDIKCKTGLFMPQDPNDEDIAEEVRRRDGRDLDNEPRYLIAHEPLIPYTDLEDARLRPKLIDIGGQVPETGARDRCKSKDPNQPAEP